MSQPEPWCSTRPPARRPALPARPPGRLVLERASQRRRRRKSVLASAPVRSRTRGSARLDPAEQLQHIPIVSERRRVALIDACASPLAVRPAARCAARRHRRAAFRTSTAAATRRRPAPAAASQQSSSSMPSTMRALPRAGDAREHRARRVGDRPCSSFAGDQRERDAVTCRPAVGVMSPRPIVRNAGLRTAAQRHPVGEPRMRICARLRRRTIAGAAGTARAPAARGRVRVPPIEHALPVDADEQRRQVSATAAIGPAGRRRQRLRELHRRRDAARTSTTAYGPSVRK